jgi:broad specificity phosphatase PhoE
MARLILIRHGESVANAERRFTHGPEEPLSERGRTEARARAEALRERIRPEALYASPFRRALDTARIIGDRFGLEPVVVEELREQFFGDLHGQPYDALDGVIDRAGVARWDYRPPGGESLREVAARVGPALDRIAGTHAGRDIVVVSHGGVMAAVRAYVEGAFGAAPWLSPNVGGFVVFHREGAYQAPEELEPLSDRGPETRSLG